MCRYTRYRSVRIVPTTDRYTIMLTMMAAWLPQQAVIADQEMVHPWTTKKREDILITSKRGRDAEPFRLSPSPMPPEDSLALLLVLLLFLFNFLCPFRLDLSVHSPLVASESVIGCTEMRSPASGETPSPDWRWRRWAKGAAEARGAKLGSLLRAELPGDPRTDTIPRQVLHACYSRVSPSAKVENPELVAWSESVAELLDLDPKE
ncbi:hypothetical protein GW17_00048810 [Ensete ventricosum]|nr:hypothetical protein GW17_00048810 [Ensete ventricosum]